MNSFEDYITHDRVEIGGEKLCFPFREEKREEFLMEMFTKEAWGSSKTKRQRLNKLMYLLKEQEAKINNLETKLEIMQKKHERDLERVSDKVFEKINKQMVIQSVAKDDREYYAATFGGENV